VDLNARGSLIMYCANGASPDGQTWTLTVEVGDTDIEAEDLIDTGGNGADADYMDTDRLAKVGPASTCSICPSTYLPTLALFRV